jgi:hypothetical protein
MKKKIEENESPNDEEEKMPHGMTRLPVDQTRNPTKGPLYDSGG